MNVSEKDLERQAPCDGGCGTVLTKVEAWAGAGAEAEADMDWASSEKHVSRPCPPQSVPEEDSTATAVTRARAVPVGECTEDDTTVTPDCQGEEPSVPTFEPPDGGLAAWSQVLAGHLINSVAWGYSTSWGVFQLYYTSHLRSSDGSPIPTAQVAWIGSAQVFLTFLICAPAGRLADAGYSRQLVFWGSVLAVGGTFLTSWCHTYWQVFLAQGVLTGFGLGWLFMPAVSVISAYFRRRRSLALAIAATGTGTGSLVFPATVQYLVPKVGFPWAVRCSGFVTLAFAVLFNVLLRPPLAPRKTGPLVEWSAFREPEYVLFVAGAFLFFWALLVGFYYVSLSSSAQYRIAISRPTSYAWIPSPPGEASRRGHMADMDGRRSTHMHVMCSALTRRRR